MMRNIQVIDGARNCVYDIFMVPDVDFNKIFPIGTDIAFIEEVYTRENALTMDDIFLKMWNNRVNKADVNGINGTLFYEMKYKKEFYPDRIDHKAINPDGSRLR